MGVPYPFDIPSRSDLECSSDMVKKGYIIGIKILVYLGLGVFILIKGEDYFNLSSGVRKILIAMLFLFAFLRMFEGYQWYRVRREE